MGEYRCLALIDAKQAIVNDGFSVGTISTNPAGQTSGDSWIVHAQVPLPGEQRPPGTAINLTVQDPSVPCP